MSDSTQTKGEKITDLNNKIAEVLVLNGQYWASIDKISLQLHEDDNEFSSAEVARMQKERSTFFSKVMDLKPLIKQYDEELRLLKTEAPAQKFQVK